MSLRSLNKTQALKVGIRAKGSSNDGGFSGVCQVVLGLNPINIKIFLIVWH